MSKNQSIKRLIPKSRSKNAQFGKINLKKLCFVILMSVQNILPRHSRSFKYLVSVVNYVSFFKILDNIAHIHFWRLGFKIFFLTIMFQMKLLFNLPLLRFVHHHY